MAKQLDSTQNQEKNNINRREFMKTAGAAAVTFMIMKPELVKGSQANSKINLGMIGCGERGSWIADLFLKNGNYNITAGADYFQDKADAFAERFGVDKSKMFTRLSGYKQLLEADVDAVAIESPPYFHPEQAQAAVAAGKHVYLAKPVAIDVPGCNTISESANKATSKNQVFLVDFQTRTDPYYIEAVKRVHEGAIGEIAFAESNFQGDGPWKKWFPLLQEDSKNPENRLRGWGCFRTLAGDIIVEQSIHSIDVDTWLLDKAPLSAVGAGGNRTRPVGDVLDWLTLFYEYEGNIGINFGGRQFNGHGTKGGITNRMFGSKGVLEAQYGGQVLIRGEGENFYKGGRSPGIYQEGAERNIASFHDHITNKNYENATVPPSVRSTMTSILGRNAGYTGERITWQELVKDTSRLEPDLDGLLT